MTPEVGTGQFQNLPIFFKLTPPLHLGDLPHLFLDFVYLLCVFEPLGVINHVGVDDSPVIAHPFGVDQPKSYKVARFT